MKDYVKDNVPKVNRQYQDSLFRFMFSDKESAIELYNAIEGTDYGLDTEVVFTTLDDVLYVESKNDLSFEIAGKYVVLTEHQSTINYNMPIRHLEYITQTYKNTLTNEDLFRRKRIPILTPEFYVIYTGKDDWQTEELRLSESYIGKPPENSLELVVKIIDVRYNKEKAKEVLSRSNKLRGYSLLLNYVNLYKQEGCSLNQAIDSAVKRCINENILQDFLTKYGKEVRGMIYEDITLERFAEIRAEEQYEQGLSEGRQQGLSRVNQLNQLLIEAGRIDDLEKASKDPEFQEELFQEFGL